MELDTALLGNSEQVLSEFPDNSIDLCFTSPSPYLHGDKGIGNETDRDEYIHSLVRIFWEVRRVLKPTGCLWLQLQDRHQENGVLDRIPEQLTNFLVAQTWQLRSKCIWVRTEKADYQEDYNRFIRDWEYLYFFTKSKVHYFNNPRQKVQSSVFYADYKAPRKNEFESGFPEKIIERCISLCCPPNGVILDPLAGAGTTGVVAKRMGRRFILIDIDPIKVDAMKGRLGIRY